MLTESDPKPPTYRYSKQKTLPACSAASLLIFRKILRIELFLHLKKTNLALDISLKPYFSWHLALYVFLQFNCKSFWMKAAIIWLTVNLTGIQPWEQLWHLGSKVLLLFQCKCLFWQWTVMFITLLCCRCDGHVRIFYGELKWEWVRATCCISLILQHCSG